jgi:hypothetical protein
MCSDVKQLVVDLSRRWSWRRCGSSLANRLMVLRGRRPVKGEPVRGSLRPAAAPHGTVAVRWPAATLDRPAPTTSLAGC